MLRLLINKAASEFDRMMTSALLEVNRRPALRGPESLDHDARISMLAGIRAVYDRPSHFDDTNSFFPPPSAPSPRLSRVRTLTGGDVIDASWASGFSPIDSNIATEYLSYEPNRSAAARLFLHSDRPRPVAILIHGYRFGQFSLEERVWPIRWLFERGLDVAITVLPMHAVRAVRGDPPRFPSSDPRITNEGFRQAIHDIRALTRFLEERGAPAVGAMGMSLGGYTTSLLATVEDALAFAVPIIPLASLADHVRQLNKLVGTDEQKRLQHEALDAAYRAVSPLARAPRIDGARVLVVGAVADRITPIDHARSLAAHFNARLETIHGGHLLQFGRGDAFRSIGRLLGRLGLLSGRR